MSGYPSGDSTLPINPVMWTSILYVALKLEHQKWLTSFFLPFNQLGAWCRQRFIPSGRLRRVEAPPGCAGRAIASDLALLNQEASVHVHIETSGWRISSATLERLDYTSSRHEKCWYSFDCVADANQVGRVGTGS